MIKKLFALTGIFCLALTARAKITLPALLNSNMVLQQQADVLLWGSSDQHSDVVIITSWDKRVYRTKPDKGLQWQVKVHTPVAGGPYQISFNDGQKITLRNILIGEVWFCSGQSNMEMALAGWDNQPVEHSLDLLMDADNDAIRLFRIKKVPSLTPANDCIGNWNVSDAETAGKFSAIAYQFGKMLQRKLKVPIGLIQAAWGGTRIDAWMDKASLLNYPQLHLPDKLDPNARNDQPPGVLYNAMVNPVIKFTVKGFLWYQGEADRDRPELYKSLFPTMVKGWRAAWALGDIPFYYVQIAPYHYGGDSTKASGPLIREVQLNALKLILNSGMAVTMDIGTQRIIHAPDKTTVALRLACWALANTYHLKGIPFAGPVYQSKEIKNGHLIVHFNGAPIGLKSLGKELSSFELAGTDHIYHPAKAKVIVGGVEVWCDQVKEPADMRYAFKEWVVGDLYNTEGLPASSFRTDSLQILSKP